MAARVKVTRSEVQGKAREVFLEEFKELPPLTRVDARAELDLPAPEYANALRRVLSDELQGPAFTHGPRFSYQCSDPALPECFVVPRILLLPVRAGAAGADLDLTFTLDVKNAGPAPVNVLARDLRAGGQPSAPLFNPMCRLAVLGQGHYLRAGPFVLRRGRGGAHSQCSNAASVPLDLTERPREETHSADGAAADLSGFVELTLEARPKKFELKYCLRAVAVTDDPAAVAAATLRAAAADLARRCAAAAAALPTVTRLGDDLETARFSLPGENRTLGSVLVRAGFDAADAAKEPLPFAGDIQFSNSDLIITVVAQDAPAAYRAAAEYARAVFERVENEFA
jgi:hypothetical protein